MSAADIYVEEPSEDVNPELSVVPPGPVKKVSDIVLLIPGRGGVLLLRNLVCSTTDSLRKGEQ